jgi:GNAT superfamily N-acetyltransferase
MIAVVPAREKHEGAFLSMCLAIYDEARAVELGPYDADAMRSIFQESIQCNLLNGKLGAGSVRVFIALDDERPIGALAVTIQPVYFSPTTLFAQEMFVWCDPSHRKSGVAAMLFEMACEWAKDAGCRGMCAGALLSAASHAVSKIVSAIGFEPIERVWVRKF